MKSRRLGTESLQALGNRQECIQTLLSKRLTTIEYSQRIVFYLPATNCKLPLNPGGLARVTMPKHLRSLVSPPQRQVMHADNLFSAAEKTKQR